MWVSKFLKLVLLLTLISLFVPLSPIMPSIGLDPSWALALNQAIAQGLAFGKQIIFTLGPYSSIYTKAYHPATDFMMISGSLYLACSYWIAIIYLTRNTAWYWILAFCILLFGMIYARDSLFYSYPLLVGLASYKVTSSKQPIQLNNKNASDIILLTLLFAPLGLLALIKGSFLILSAMIGGLCGVFFAVHKKTSLAIIPLAAPLFSMLLFWVGAGQFIGNLPSYLINTSLMALSFTEAMATMPNTQEVACFLLTALILLVFIALQKQLPKATRLFLGCIFFVFLFLSFKTGFSRYYGHAFIPASSILIAALVLPFIVETNAILLIPLVFSLSTWAYIENHYTHVSIENNFKSTFSAAYYGLMNRLNDHHPLKEDFDIIMDYLKNQIAFPKLQGTTDIYSYNQSYLISSQNNWSPRPIFQSYSVFTHNFAHKNKQHLLGSHSPNNIIFKLEAIDSRVPSLEDGVSWPLLITKYQPSQWQNNFLFLKKNTEFHEEASVMIPLATEKHRLGEMIHVPSSAFPVFTEIEIKPTLLGYLANIFYQPSQLTMTFQLVDGTQKQYRIIASMAKSGFLISPLIETTNEFAQLFNQQIHLEKKRVESFVIASDQGKLNQWYEGYLIHFKQIRTAPTNRITSPN